MSARIELTPEAQATLRMMQTLPEEMVKGIAGAMDAENQKTIAHIESEYLSFPKSGPPMEMGLRVQSDRLRGAVRAATATISGQSVSSSIGDSVKYAAIHEFGGRIVRKAHTGTVRLRTTQLGELLRNKRGGAVFAKASHKRAKEVGFASEGYTIDMPARGMFQRGIEDRLESYGESISDAIEKAFLK